MSFFNTIVFQMYTQYVFSPCLALQIAMTVKRCTYVLPVYHYSDDAKISGWKIKSQALSKPLYASKFVSLFLTLAFQMHTQHLFSPYLALQIAMIVKRCTDVLPVYHYSEDAKISRWKIKSQALSKPLYASKFVSLFLTLNDR